MVTKELKTRFLGAKMGGVRENNHEEGPALKGEPEKGPLSQTHFHSNLPITSWHPWKTLIGPHADKQLPGSQQVFFRVAGSGISSAL